MKHFPCYSILVIKDKNNYTYIVEQVVNHTLYKPGDTLSPEDLKILVNLDTNIVYRSVTAWPEK